MTGNGCYVNPLKLAWKKLVKSLQVNIFLAGFCFLAQNVQLGSLALLNRPLEAGKHIHLIYFCLSNCSRHLYDRSLSQIFGHSIDLSLWNCSSQFHEFLNLIFGGILLIGPNCAARIVGLVKQASGGQQTHPLNCFMAAVLTCSFYSNMSEHVACISSLCAIPQFHAFSIEPAMHNGW